jgi:hypothetical protein
MKRAWPLQYSFGESTHYSNMGRVRKGGEETNHSRLASIPTAVDALVTVIGWSGVEGEGIGGRKNEGEREEREGFED